MRRVREGKINTAFGEFQLTAYRDQTAGKVHLALSRGRDNARPADSGARACAIGLTRPGEQRG